MLVNKNLISTLRVNIQLSALTKKIQVFVDNYIKSPPPTFHSNCTHKEGCRMDWLKPQGKREKKIN